jgi:hypothetical protein
VGSLITHNPIGLHGLYGDNFTFLLIVIGDHAGGCEIFNVLKALNVANIRPLLWDLPIDMSHPRVCIWCLFKCTLFENCRRGQSKIGKGIGRKRCYTVTFV